MTLKSFSPIILRIGLALVFFWFSYQQFANPEQWVRMLPSWTQTIPISQIAFIHLNAWFEVTFGILLLVGFYTRIVALLLALHLFGIVVAVGYGPIGVRDFGLMIATLSVFFYGASDYSLDMFFNHEQPNKIS